jgi:hypothetical protein
MELEEEGAIQAGRTVNKRSLHGPEPLSTRRLKPLPRVPGREYHGPPINAEDPGLIFNSTNEYRRLARSRSRARRIGRMESFLTGQRNIETMIQKAVTAGRNYVNLKRNGRRATLRAVCGDLKNVPRIRGGGARYRFSAAYDVLKIAVKCMKREMRHQGFIHKRWSAATRLKRIDAKQRTLGDQKAKLLSRVALFNRTGVGLD